ncbi:MAG: hypothetical protein EP338_08970 [Bacteroidetes bacterium]|nr:MAG: hypothetical protein EP338_08970 [Bacteroidota bacterium]
MDSKEFKDTLIENYLIQGKKAIIAEYQSFREKTKKDSILKNTGKDSLQRKIKYSGDVSLAHDYGLLPALVDSNQIDPISMYSSEGIGNVEFMGVPLKLNYHYANYQVPYGLNNYFRVGVDLERLKELKKERLKGINKEYEERKELNKLGKDSLRMKQEYLQVLQDYLKRKLENEREQYQEKLKDTLSAGAGKESDSIREVLRLFEEKMAYYDRMEDSLNWYQDRMEELSDDYESVDYDLEKEKLKAIEKLKMKAVDKQNEYTGGVLAGLKKFNLGLSYPRTTAMSETALPLKGVDLAYQYKNWYTFLASGLTVNTLMFTNNQFENKLTNTQNLLNFFDFQVLKKNQLLSLVRTGYGKPESDHAFVGIRYLTPLPFLNSDSNNEVEKSLGLELDLRMKIDKGFPGTLDVVYGKTSLGGVDEGTGPIEEKGFFRTRTNLGLLKWEQKLSKLRSSYTLAFRWLDPYVDNSNLGVMQSDNVRLEVQSKHRLNSRIQLGLQGRTDRNNLLAIQDSTMRIDLMGIEGQASFGRLLNVVGHLNYVSMANYDRNASLLSSQDNYLVTVNLNSNHQLKKMNGFASFTYSDNALLVGDQYFYFRNIGGEYRLSGRRIANTVSYYDYQTNNLDESNEMLETGIISDRIELSLKSLKISAELSYSPDISEENYGFYVDLAWSLGKNTTFISKIEKPILGNYYETYFLDRYQRFPYTIQSKIVFNINSK